MKHILTLALRCAAVPLIICLSWLVVPAMAQDRGFVHPGGIHTQDDFDRVRAQIAAGNTKVKQAYQKLKKASYAQPTVATSPTETIVRGGGSGENYMNAAVRILMAWARKTRAIGGDTNYALAAGLYGYQFAQAAELMRDYDGWSRDDFKTFQQWMLEVWYPSSIGFLCGRNGTWENAGKWWRAPGHYWSNWGLCNAMCVALIGIPCDDVFIYNQGMSFFKYDQVGNFTVPPTLHEVTGHGDANGGVGLAVDMAKIGWSQGDDLFAYMDHRLASGIEYLAAQTQSVANLPWTDYMYGTNGLYYTDGRAWLMTEPALGAQMRPYWGAVIGIYEGVKGVKMPFSERAYNAMGIDEGGKGSTSTSCPVSPRRKSADWSVAAPCCTMSWADLSIPIMKTKILAFPQATS